MRQAVLLLASCLSAAASQTTYCDVDYQCLMGYCDKAVGGVCKKCLHCEDFKRSPPATPIPCIKTVSDCGACFEGLVESATGDIQEACAARRGAIPTYAWLAVGGLLLFAVLLFTVVYVLRNKHTLRILTSARTSVQSPCAHAAEASAPELPPPYNTLYIPVRADSPAPAPPALKHDEDADCPFLKHVPVATPAREAAGNQAANVYHNPAYVRGPHLPADYTEREPEPEYLHDETTAESLWTPSDFANNNSANENFSSGSARGSVSAESSGSAASGAGAGEGAGAGVGLPALLEAARGTVLLRPPRAHPDAAPPAKHPRLQQDTNNNSSGRERDRDDGDTMSRAGGPTFNIHVNVQQVNDVKL